MATGTAEEEGWAKYIGSRAEYFLVSFVSWDDSLGWLPLMSPTIGRSVETGAASSWIAMPIVRSTLTYCGRTLPSTECRSSDIASCPIMSTSSRFLASPTDEHRHSSRHTDAMLRTGTPLTNRAGMCGKDDIIPVRWMNRIFGKHCGTRSSILCGPDWSQRWSCGAGRAQPVTARRERTMSCWL